MRLARIARAVCVEIGRAVVATLLMVVLVLLVWAFLPSGPRGPGAQSSGAPASASER